jgi:hypothetical protein
MAIFILSHWLSNIGQQIHRQAPHLVFYGIALLCEDDVAARTGRVAQEIH